MAVTGFYLPPEGTLQRDLTEQQAKEFHDSGAGLLWLDITGTTEEDIAYLRRIFGFHPLALEDCLSDAIHAPKIDDFGSYIFIVVHGINYAAESEIVTTAELNIFLGPNYVVSNHNIPLHSLESVKARVGNDARPMQSGADFLAHAIIDALIDNVLPTIYRMNDAAEEIEELTLRNPHPSTMEDILKLKRSTLRIRRVMTPQREMMNRLSRDNYPAIKSEARIYFRDVYDHLTRIEDLNQSLQDRADNALTIYLSSVTNRQNETMKVLSIVAAIFLPLTLLAGIYGMNFEYMPELTWRWGYFGVLGVMGAVIVGVIWWFWARRWLAWGRGRISRIQSFIATPDKLVHRMMSGIKEEISEGK